MAQARNYQRANRVLSGGSGGGANDHHEYPTKTLFDHIKEKKVILYVA